MLEPSIRFAVALFGWGAMAGALHGQAPDSSAPPFRTWAQALPYHRGVVVWLQNTGADTLHVTRVTASNCQNIGAGCGVTELGLEVAPRDSVAALTVRPRLWDDRYGYQLSWDWEIRRVTTPSE